MIKSKVPTKEFYDGWDRIFSNDKFKRTDDRHELERMYGRPCYVANPEVYDETDKPTTYKEDQHH